MDNPCPNWLSDAAWDNITELDKLTNFHGIITSFEQYPRDWHIWYTSPEPEVASLPSDYSILFVLKVFTSSFLSEFGYFFGLRKSALSITHPLIILAFFQIKKNVSISFIENAIR